MTPPTKTPRRRRGRGAAIWQNERYLHMPFYCEAESDLQKKGLRACLLAGWLAGCVPVSPFIVPGRFATFTTALYWTEWAERPSLNRHGLRRVVVIVLPFDRPSKAQGGRWIGIVWTNKNSGHHHHHINRHRSGKKTVFSEWSISISCHLLAGRVVRIRNNGKYDAGTPIEVI